MKGVKYPAMLNSTVVLPLPVDMYWVKGHQYTKVNRRKFGPNCILYTITETLSKFEWLVFNRRGNDIVTLESIQNPLLNIDKFVKGSEHFQQEREIIL